MNKEKIIRKVNLQLFGQDNITMDAKDAVSAKLAQCFITINGRRYNFMQAINVEVKFEKEKVEIPILGRVSKGNKSVGSKGTGSATFHFNTSIFVEALLYYQDTGEDLYFEMQITNEDPTSKVGRQTIILFDCNVDGGIISKFDATAEYLEVDMDFTYERASMPERFRNLLGME